MTDLAGSYERAQTDELRKRLADATETWLDPVTGIVWRVPTAWAYAQACKARDALEAKLKSIEGSAR